MLYMSLEIIATDIKQKYSDSVITELDNVTISLPCLHILVNHTFRTKYRRDKYQKCNDEERQQQFILKKYQQ